MKANNIRISTRTRVQGMAKSRGAALLMVMMILIVMTLMLFFNARMTSFEQIISGNDRRAKLAQHAAEAGLNHAMRYFTRNLREINSVEGSGWLAASGANGHWLPCSANDTTLPCSAASLAADGRADGFTRENVFYYVEDPDALTLNTYLPLSALVTEYDGADPPAPIDSTNYRVQALLCVMDYDQDRYVSGDDSTYAKCSQSGTPTGINLALRLVSVGTSDDGSAEAIITQTLANVEPGGGPPTVPIMTFNSIAPSGTFNIVVAPNGAGVGIPVSIWSRNLVTIAGGSFSTCELEEYLADQSSDAWRTWVDSQGLEYVTCDSCRCPDKEAKGSLSHSPGSEPGRKYYDIVDEDPLYPDDIFEYYFGVARTEYATVRDAADEVLADCSTVDASSHGLIWVDGYCNLGSGEVGSATAPLALVTTAGVRLNANSVFYGVLLITDPRVAPAAQAVNSIPVDLNGGPVIYGAILNDPGAAAMNGGFTVVFIEDILSKIHPLIILGNLAGSWSDQDTFN